MNPAREEALFALALEKSAGERAAFLARASDISLRRRVEALLVAPGSLQPKVNAEVDRTWTVPRGAP